MRERIGRDGEDVMTEGMGTIERERRASGLYNGGVLGTGITMGIHWEH